MPDKNHLVLAVVDCSGSMAGQAAAVVGVQLHDLLAELQADRNAERIQFGILGYRGEAFWMLPPMPVAEVNDLPPIQIKADSDGFFPIGRLSSAWSMLAALLHNNRLFPDGTEGIIHIVLFTDALPTERMSVLRDSLDLFCSVEPVESGHCFRYLIRQPSKLRNDKMRYREALMLRFAGNKQHFIQADSFALWLNGFVAGLSGDAQAASGNAEYDVFSAFGSSEDPFSDF